MRTYGDDMHGQRGQRPVSRQRGVRGRQEGVRGVERVIFDPNDFIHPDLRPTQGSRISPTREQVAPNLGNNEEDREDNEEDEENEDYEDDNN